MSGTRLPGGFVNAVVRVGDTVRRAPGQRAAYVHELLRHFERSGWAGAPRRVRLICDAYGPQVRACHDRVAEHRAAFERALRQNEGVAAWAAGCPGEGSSIGT
ncbi:hypothetical protein ACIBI9_17390 [Nonomuraea sp. NPDC050451]|uniref:hypothetical protein n=1 Tax=Nonomuraea sp. NPDC050451 TaxID=3364364 RepID=UPI0037986FDD